MEEAESFEEVPPHKGESEDGDHQKSGRCTFSHMFSRLSRA